VTGNVPARIARRLVRDKRTGCLLWTGPVNEKGYGIVWWRGRRARVHRVLFELAQGRPPRRGLELMHSCDVLRDDYRRCAEPSHVREATTKENAQDRQRKGRTRGCCGPRVQRRKAA
jgi:hypothetical protein